VRDLLVAENPSLEISDLEADGAIAGDLLTLASPSLFGDPRLIRVSALEKTSDGFLADALRYVASPVEDTTLVLRHGGGQRGKALLDAIRAASDTAIEIVCAPLAKPAEKYEFAAAEFRSAGRSVTPSALRALVDAFADDLAELASACGQLVSDTTGDITELTVATYYAGRVETNSFQVADAALDGRLGDALVLLRHAVATGAEPVPMVAAIAMKVRAMAKVYGTRGGSGQLAGELGLAPWQIDRARKDGAAWDPDGLRRAVETVAETDALVKGGGRDPIFALERLLALLAARGRA
jgi:DNA polymerase III subunit delta